MRRGHTVSSLSIKIATAKTRGRSAATTVYSWIAHTTTATAHILTRSVSEGSAPETSLALRVRIN